MQMTIVSALSERLALDHYIPRILSSPCPYAIYKLFNFARISTIINHDTSIQIKLCHLLYHAAH